MSALQGTICRNHTESLFLYHTSPLLRKVKPAVLVTIKSDCMKMWRSRKNAMCKASGLHMTEMRSTNNSSLFLIYDEQELTLSLEREKAISILEKYGYKSCATIEEMLRHLSHWLSEDNFPHEIGLFLGYPPGDVKAYIENEGKNCTCCRYWKVYEDVETAQKTWAKIDEAQALALNVLQNLPPIHIAVNLLKAVQASTA